MTPIAELGPIDPVIYYDRARRFVPIQSIMESFNRIIEALRSGLPDRVISELLDRLPIIEIGDYERALEHNRDLLVRILKARMLKGNEGKAGEAAEKLTSYKQHSAAVTVSDLMELGIKVRLTNEHEEELLWRLYQSFVDNIIETEELTPPEATEEVNIKLGKGILIARKPIMKEEEE